MKCPVCGGNTGICLTRPQVDHVKRRRKCYECNFRFNTIEVDMDMLDAGFLIHANDTLDLTEVKAAIKRLNKCSEEAKEAKEAEKQLNDFMERVCK